MNTGDLVKLKGFDKTNHNDIPHGIIITNLGIGKVKVRWLNKTIAIRWQLTDIISIKKLALLNKA